MRRAAIIVLVVIAVLLIGMGSAVYSRPMDGWSVAWFAMVALVSAIVSAVVARVIFRAFRRRELRSTFDQFYWIVLFILPASISLSVWALWIITLYFTGSL